MFVCQFSWHVLAVSPDLEISNVVFGLSVASNSERRQLSDDDIDLFLGSLDDKDSDDSRDLDPCYLENDGDISYDNDEEGGSSLSAILGGAAASNNGWVTPG